MSKSKISNTGELREFLVNMMLGVKDGVLDTDKASKITKLAGEINDNLYAELKSHVVMLSMGKEASSIGELGTMNIGKASGDIT